MIILASQSPRRRELLASAGIPFVIRVAGIDESAQAGELPQQYVRRIAARKALAVPKHGDECVLGADTTVTVDGRILGKPTDAQDAAGMLRQLSGRTHEVLTGICMRYRSGIVIDASVTEVEFARISEEDIGAYVASGEPMDKAGAYAIQGIASRYVVRIDGCYANVVGLPVSLVFKYLRKWSLI